MASGALEMVTIDLQEPLPNGKYILTWLATGTQAATGRGPGPGYTHKSKVK